jgi:hypothetical protein
VLVAVVLSACAALVSFDGLYDGDAPSRAAAAATRGLAAGIGPMTVPPRLDSVDDASRLVQMATSRSRLRFAALGVAVMVAVAATRRIRAVVRGASGQRISAAFTSSRAPPPAMVAFS